MIYEIIIYLHPVSTVSTPVLPSERHDILDVLRGFAILGIFMANSGGFSLYVFLQDETKDAFSTHAIDNWLDMFLTAFVEGKFYSLFSLLFGIGFTIILDRNVKAGRNPLVIFYRRLFVLALMGLGHIFLLWEGDILLLYALIGMVLPLFRNLKDKTLIITSIILIFSPVLFDLVKVLTNGEWDLAKPIGKMALKADEASGITEENFRTYLVDNTTYQSILNWCRGGIYWRYEYIIGSNRIPKVLAMFLIGYVAGRRMIFAKLDENVLLLKKIRKWGFIIGIPASLAFALFEHDEFHLPSAMGLTDTFSYAVSVIPLSLAYTSSICLLWLVPSWKKRLAVLAPVGRMALTNYILQTVFGIFIYYGIGLALGAKSGPAVYLPIVFGIYAIQIIYSNIWFRYFKYGPLEWVWRQLTYWKIISIK